MAKIKISQVAAAIRKNGLKHISGTMFQIDNGESLYPDDIKGTPKIPFEPTAACALGQAAYNLNVKPYQLSDALDHIQGDSAIYPLGSSIMSLNDNKKESLDTIATAVENWIALHGDQIINVPSSKKLYKKG